MHLLHGIIPALITPFHADGTIDFASYERLVQRQLAAGVHGLCPCGTTGEATTLTPAERKSLIAITVQLADKNVPVIAGAGINSTAEAIGLAQDAEAVGADSLLIVTPYYNRPSQAGLFAHYKAIHDAVSLPIVLYDVPSRTAVSLEDDTILRLAELPRITGLKDASGKAGRTAGLRQILPADFVLLAGDDIDLFSCIAAGGNGVISVIANIFPEAIVALYQQWQQHDRAQAEEMFAQYAALIKLLFIESNPTPTKFLLSHMGACRETVRLPLVPPSNVHQQQLLEAFSAFLPRASSMRHAV